MPNFSYFVYSPYWDKMLYSQLPTLYLLDPGLCEDVVVSDILESINPVAVNWQIAKLSPVLCE
jgi:hypothetical protein